MPVLTVRLSAAELAVIDLAASGQGLQRSAYVRQRLIPEPAPLPKQVDWGPVLQRARRRLGEGVAEQIRALQR
ncbi:MAG TPA: hypothetical protein PLX89_00015 [Verrucomicrobiota bacterium]|nr:hypothetical protein [Verrucomicrobiales bacterium]HRI11361.1 hypothetical protein [Verrucomicrobiota bacterium]